MIVEKVFDTEIYRFQCTDTSIYKNKELVDCINRVFDLDEIKNFNYDGHSQIGRGLSFCQHPYLFLNNLPGTSRLTDWVSECFLSVKEQLGKEGTQVIYKRAWGNRIYKGTQGRSHDHEGRFKLDAVGIFYTDVPEDSSDLVILNTTESGKLYSEFKEEDRYHVKPKEGEFIIHNPLMFHAVSEHKSELPRSCFVYDIIYN